MKFLAVILLFCTTFAAATELRIGVVSERANQPDYVIAQYQELIALLRLRLLGKGVNVGELVVAKDLPDMAAKLRRSEVDVVMESLFSQLWLEQQGVLLDISLAGWRRGRRESRSVFFVAQDSDVRKLSDLGGKTLVLETPRSTTAYALPKMVLADAGFRVIPREEAKGGRREIGYLLAGDEINEAYWVAHAKADVGAFSTEDWEEVPENLRRQLKVIHTTAPVLRWLVAYRSRFPLDVREHLNHELTNLDASVDGQKALAAMRRTTRFDLLTAQDLAVVQQWRRIGSKSRFGR